MSGIVLAFVGASYGGNLVVGNDGTFSGAPMAATAFGG